MSESESAEQEKPDRDGGHKDRFWAQDPALFIPCPLATPLGGGSFGTLPGLPPEWRLIIMIPVYPGAKFSCLLPGESSL